MKHEKLAEALDLIDEKYVNEGAPKGNTKKPQFLLKAAVVAAVFVLLVGTALIFPLSEKKPPENIPSPDEITSDRTETVYGGENTTENLPDSDFITSDTTESVPNTENTEEITTNTEEITQSTEKNTESEPSVTDEPEYVNGLPVLKQSKISGGGFGYEGLSVFYPWELDSNNPWNEGTYLETLSVFKNYVAEVSEGLYGQAPIFLNEEEMTERLYAVAEKYGKEIKCTVYDREGKYGSYKDGDEYGTLVVFGICEDVILSVGSMGGIRFDFDYTIVDFYMSEEELAEHGSYDIKPMELDLLAPESETVTKEELDEIVALINSEFPNSIKEDVSETYIEISYKPRTGEKDVFPYVYFFDRSDDVTENILNFNFGSYRIGFSDDMSKITSVSVPSDRSVYTEKLGDYPIIDADTAMAYLLAGDYVTTIPEFVMISDTISSEQVHKCELVYLTSHLNEYFMPYYKFYVRIQDVEAPVVNENGEELKHYGIFYVPAVREEYISDYSTAINGQWIIN